MLLQKFQTTWWLSEQATKQPVAPAGPETRPMSEVQQFCLQGCGMSMPLRGNTSTFGSFFLQKPHTPDNLKSVSWRGVLVLSPYDVLTILFELFRLSLLGESGEAKLHLQRIGQPPRFFEQQYWLGHWMKRQILGDWLGYKDSLLFQYALFSFAYRTCVTSPRIWLYSQCVLDSCLLSQ